MQVNNKSSGCRRNRDHKRTFMRFSSILAAFIGVSLLAQTDAISSKFPFGKAARDFGFVGANLPAVVGGRSLANDKNSAVLRLARRRATRCVSMFPCKKNGFPASCCERSTGLNFFWGNSEDLDGVKEIQCVPLHSLSHGSFLASPTPCVDFF